MHQLRIEISLPIVKTGDQLEILMKQIDWSSLFKQVSESDQLDGSIPAEKRIKLDDCDVRITCEDLNESVVEEHWPSSLPTEKLKELCLCTETNEDLCEREENKLLKMNFRKIYSKQ